MTNQGLGRWPAAALLAAALAFSVVGCGDDGGGEGSTAGSGADEDTGQLVGDISDDDAGAIDGDTLPADGVAEDAEGDSCVGAQCPDGGDTSADTEPPIACPGGAGCECVKNNECDAGICIDTAEGKRCGQICVSDCPKGFTCKQYGAGDVVYVCLPNYLSLCSPCGSNQDCKSQGGDGLCLDYGDHGSFCGGLCSNDDECPNGYQCVDAFDDDTGKLSKQCKLAKTDNEEGGEIQPVCGCSLWAKAAAMKTACKVSNEFGSCPGERSCTAAGMGACAGITPAKEACDGVDDDCDGGTDEGSCDDDNACTQDACDSAAGKCTHTAATDCDDANPCTADACDPADGQCKHGFSAGSCDDGDTCSEGDFCAQGDGGAIVCTPGAVTKTCDDNNLCTDDACEADKGCVYLPNAVTQACYGGAAGTDGVGPCMSGVQKCAEGKLVDACFGEVVPVIQEKCDGKDDSCNGVTDEGCKPIGVSGGFSAAGGRIQGVGKSAAVSFGGQSPAGTVKGDKTLQAGFISWLLSVL